MRIAAIINIIVSEILILVLLTYEVNASTISLISTMVVVVLISFTLSAALRYIKALHLTRNYLISGSIGVFLGIVYYLWASSNVENIIHWFESYGINILLFVILLNALFLFIYKGNKKAEPEGKNPDSEEESETTPNVEPDRES